MHRAWLLIALIGCGRIRTDEIPVPDGDPGEPPSMEESPGLPEQPPFATIAPVKISAGLVCTAGPSNASPRLAIDAAGDVYAAFTCGATAQLAVSHDRGRTYTAPVALSNDLPATAEPIARVAIARGPDDVLYAAVIGDNSEVLVKTSSDLGATWAPAVNLGASEGPTAGLALVAHGDEVYVGFAAPGGGVAVARNHARGTGAFAITTVAVPLHFLHVLYDESAGKLVIATDEPQYHVAVSSDGGVTFEPVVDPPASQYYSDWAAGGGTLFAAGTEAGGSTTLSAMLYVIAIRNPRSLVAVTGLPVVTGNEVRSVAASAASEAFIVSQLNDGSVQLDHLAAGGTALDPARSIAVAGEAPIAAALPADRGAVIMYTLSTQVWVGIQIY